MRNKIGFDDAHAREIRQRLEEEFGTLYAALETAARKGEKGLAPAGLPEKEARVIAEIAAEKIVPPKYEVGALVEVSSRSPEGIEQVKKTLLAAASEPSAEVHISYAGAPRYRVRVTADDYKQAEKALDAVIEKIRGGVGKHDAFSFKREISRKYGGSS